MRSQNKQLSSCWTSLHACMHSGSESQPTHPMDLTVSLHIPSQCPTIHGNHGCTSCPSNPGSVGPAPHPNRGRTDCPCCPARPLSGPGMPWPVAAPRPGWRESERGKIEGYRRGRTTMQVGLMFAIYVRVKFTLSVGRTDAGQWTFTVLLRNLLTSAMNRRHTMSVIFIDAAEHACAPLCMSLVSVWKDPCS
jgi:hypothetical protein